MANWQKAKIINRELAAEDMLSLVLVPENWTPHKPGQHYELRLPGMVESRAFSVVSSTKRVGELEFGIQLIPGGVLSPKLWEAQVGDEIEIDGPRGRTFVWEEAITGPVVLLGAGSGITPLLCIYDAFRDTYPEGVIRFLESAKEEGKIMNFSKMKDDLIVRITQKDGRINKEFLQEKVGDLANSPETKCYICGPNAFIDSMFDLLVELGFPQEGIKTERFI